MSEHDPNGRQGDPGVAGRQGEAGVPGREGVAGREGATGRAGERGPRGASRHLRWTPFIGYAILAVAGIVVAVQLYHLATQNRALIERNKGLIDRVAKDCVDRDGDLSYRSVLRGLIHLNHNQHPATGKPLGTKATPAQRSALTAQLLERGLAQAGPVPPCIEAGAG